MRGKTWITWLEVSNSALEMASSMASSATRLATVSVSAMLCSKCENNNHVFCCYLKDFWIKQLFTLFTLQNFIKKEQFSVQFTFKDMHLSAFSPSFCRLRHDHQPKAAFHSCLPSLILLAQWTMRVMTNESKAGHRREQTDMVVWDATRNLCQKITAKIIKLLNSSAIKHYMKVSMGTNMDSCGIMRGLCLTWILGNIFFLLKFTLTGNGWPIRRKRPNVRVAKSDVWQIDGEHFTDWFR